MHLFRDQRRFITGVLRKSLVLLAFIDPSDALAAASFSSISPGLSAVREAHTTTLMQNGKVLVAGGNSPTTPASSVDILDLGSGTFTTATMSGPRVYHTATVLKNGKVLLAGGANAVVPLNTAELYDPVNGTFTPTTGSMAIARYGHTATLLNDGRVLITGGDTLGGITSTAEVFNPATGLFTATSNTMSSVRHVHAATLLPSGKVLVTGGYTPAATPSADLFDPGTTMFTATGLLNTARYYHAATMLDNGKVLISGGYTGAGTTNTTELFDPATGVFTYAGNLTIPRDRQTATLLPNGKVLLTGGQTPGSTITNTAELFDPSTNTSASTASMASARFLHTATLLPSGKVLITAGSNAIGAPTSSMELYDLGAGGFTATGALIQARMRHTSTALPNGKILLAGGYNGATELASAELFDPATGTYTATGSMTTARSYHVATLLTNGKVLITGGVGRSSAEIYDPQSGMFSATGSMSIARQWHTATLLQNGKVFVAGGFPATISTELYDPIAGTFSAGPGFFFPTFYHAAVLLNDGRVLVSGGQSIGINSEDTDRLGYFYDPTTNTFPAFHVFTYRRYLHSATLLPGGKVLLAGGVFFALSFEQNQPIGELYDPLTDTSPETGGTSAVHRSHAAVLLANGNVLLVGGLSSSAEIFEPMNLQFSEAGTTPQAFDVAASALPNGKVLITGGSEFFLPSGVGAVYDPGLGFSESKRPTVASAGPICQPATLMLTGTGFAGASEGSAGSFQSSAANAPMLRLQRLHGDERMQFVVPQTWSSTSLSASISALTTGFYRLAVVSSAVASAEQLIEVESAIAPLLGNYATSSTVQGTNVAVTPSAPFVYEGTSVRIAVAASLGFAGTLSVNGQSGVVTVSNARPVGQYTITVSATTGCATTTRTFLLTVTQIEAPVITATAISSGQVNVTWPAVPGAASYDVFRSSGTGPFTQIGSTATTTFNSSGLTINTSYLYQAQAIDNTLGAGPLSNIDLATTIIFSDDPLQAGITAIKAIHITQARTAVSAVRAAAGLTPFSFTDSSLGGQAVKAIHVQELRTALDPARAALGVAPIVYTYPATMGSLIYAADVTEVRNGVK